MAPERWLGRPYVPGRYDCADLVADVLREEYGVEVALPGRAASLRARDAQIQAVADAVGVPVREPRDGDVVLMRRAGRRHAIGHHVGVWHTPPGHAPHVLHCTAGAGTCLHPLAELAGRGLELTGVYRVG